MHLPLKGIIPPLVTPLKNYDQLDIQGLENLIEHLITGGVHGIFILGTNGEAPSLNVHIKKELIRRTGKIINHRIPLLVGIFDTSLSVTLEVAEYAKKNGANAVVITPPYYFPLDQEEVYLYYKTLTSSLSLPFFIYNIPSHTKVRLSLETVKKIKALGALGIKDSSGDIFYFYSLIDAFKDSPDFSLITGTELFLPETIMYGGHGAVAGGANVFPQLFVKLYEASLKQDLGTVSVLRKQVMELYNTIYQISKHPSGIIAGIKCALSVMGLCEDYMAPPLQKLSGEERGQMEHMIKNITSTTNVSIQS